jgi:outer membrane immunogenic protein
MGIQPELECGRRISLHRFSNRGTAFTVPDGFGGVFATGTSSSRLHVEQATARLNYRFGGPVVAKY